MSQIAAVVRHGVGEVAPSSSSLADVLRSWIGDSVRVEEAPRAALGISLLGVDSARLVDRQPLVDQQARLAIVADCRLDNRADLQADLSAHGATDAEIIMRGYQRWGRDLASHLLGDFAVIVWDWDRRQTVAFRDPLGVKPLFYCEDESSLALASDVDVLLRLMNAPAVPDDTFVIEHLLWKYVSVDRTYWSTIHRLPGGHSLLKDGNRRISTQRYWNPAPFNGPLDTLADACAAFREKFFTSVKRRMASAGPVSAHLSGGIDSSSIVCIADEIRRKSIPPPSWPLYTISERFPAMSCDEGEYIQSVTEATHTIPICFDGRSSDSQDLWAPSPVGPRMDRFRTSGSREDVRVARFIGSSVLLSGQAGDQIGSPIGVADDLAGRRLFASVGGFVGGRKISAAASIANARRLFKSITPRRVRHLVATRRFSRSMPRWLLPKWRSLAAHLSSEPYTKETPAFEHEVQAAHWREITSGPLGFALDLEQRVGALGGVEIRFPFLDQELVELVLSMPPSCWPDVRSSSRLQREALGYWLPPLVRQRTGKALFSPLILRRAKREEPYIRRFLFEGRWAADEYVDRAAAISLFNSVISSGWVDWRSCNELGNIVTCEAWLRRMFGYTSRLGGA